jgi:hypothetical protein
MFPTIQHHHTQNIDRSNISLCTCYSRTLVRSALRWSNATIETIESDLIIYGCTKEYLRHTGQKIDRLEAWELDLIGKLYRQLTKNIPPTIDIRLGEIGKAIRAYIDRNDKI